MNEKDKGLIINNNFHGLKNENSRKTEIKIIKYNKENINEEPFDKCIEINENETTWIKITNIKDDKFLQRLFKCLNLNEHLFERILNVNYIPEIENYKNYIYIKLTAFYFKKEYQIIPIQVSLILGKNYIISLHQREAELFKPITDRLKIQEHIIREKGSDFLAYTFIDIILDSYVTILKQLEEQISKSAEKMMDPSSNSFKIIRSHREELDKIRNYVLPIQQIINSMELTESPLIKQSTNSFLMNFRNHVNQVILRIDTLSNRITEIRDIYNSSMSRRLDEIVRVLTVVTVIFAPGTFIVGIYGMNFQFMPELGQAFAYPIVLLINFTIIFSMLIYFKKKNWI